MSTSWDGQWHPWFPMEIYGWDQNTEFSVFPLSAQGGEEVFASTNGRVYHVMVPNANGSQVAKLVQSLAGAPFTSDFVGDIQVEPNAVVSALGRLPHYRDLFVQGATDGGMYTTYCNFDPNNLDATQETWNPWTRIDNQFVPGGFGGVSAVSRNPSQIDLFCLGTENGVWSTWWNPTAGWQNWYRIDSGFQVFSSITRVASIARTPSHIDLFVVRDDGGIYSTFWDADPNVFWPAAQPLTLPPVPTSPSVFGPLEITPFSSSADLQVRRLLIERAFHLNLGGPDNANRECMLDYLREAYYFVPLYLGWQLQQAGQYPAALDWLRTVYDYGARVSQRKIAYNLVLEESLTTNYQRAADWLLDPLNPHAIAATRANAYTRYTLLTLVQCFLAYADAEFTSATPESVVQARELYLTALDLLDSDELHQRLGLCDDVIATIEITVGDPVLSSFVNILKGELGSIQDYTTLTKLVPQIRDLLAGPGGSAARFAAATKLITAAKVGMAPSPTLGATIANKASFLANVHTALLANPTIYQMVQSATLRAAGQYVGNTNTLPSFHPLAPPSAGSAISATGVLADPLVGGPPAGEAGGPAEMRIVPSSHDTSTTKLIGKFQPLNSGKPAFYVPLGYIPAPSFDFCVPPNPVLQALRMHAELNLYKLRNCLNIAGMQQQLDPYAAPTDTQTGLPMIGVGGQLVLPGALTLQPTPYPYTTLIERAKQLVQLASQMEAAMLAALEKRDAEDYNALKARQDVESAQAGVQLSNLQVTEATDGIQLAQLQQQRAQIQVDYYQQLLDAGTSDLELASLGLLGNVATLQAAAATVDFGAAAASGWKIWTTGSESAQFLAGGLTETAAAVSTTASILSTLASYERRTQDWTFQKTLAQQDVLIGAEQVTTAQDHLRVVGQQQVIAQMTADHASAIVDFLSNKFTNADLYDWMSNVLEGVYSFFLQQATSMAQLASNQLAFERQQVPPQYIQTDYWQSPSDLANTGQSVTQTDGQTVNRLGLTGSERLLQDIYQLDQYAFATNQRKLQLSTTISLMQLDPYSLARFQQTGVLTFATPMQLFDQDFPGHYLRLIRRVRTSVIALIPPSLGIRATLSSSGLSRVVVGGQTYQTVTVQRDPEVVALTSPTNATGVFDLDPQSDLLLPFEGTGVDTTWEFRMPKAANPFDFSTIADVQITIDFAAFDSADYRKQVIQSLPSSISAQCAYSFRQQFADQWYDLNNPLQTATPMVVTFTTEQTDFPPNLADLRIQQVTLFFALADGVSPFEVSSVGLTYGEQGGAGIVGGGATTINDVISTRNGNGSSWLPMIGMAPTGSWTLDLTADPNIQSHLGNEDVSDILFVITYTGRTPPWPA